MARVEATLKLAQVRQEAAQYRQTLWVEAETAHRQIRNILESITDAFVAFDQQWRYTYVQIPALALTAYAGEINYQQLPCSRLSKTYLARQ